MQLLEGPADVVGRRSEIAHARRLLTRFPLVTITGVGGVGKTYVALQVAHRIKRGFQDACLVDLTRLPEVGSPAGLVTAALGLGVPPGAGVTDRLVEHLVGRSTLLVLDTCDQALEEIARLVHALVTSSPRLRIVATSREPLGVAGEATMDVPPWALSGEGPRSLRELARVPAVALLLQRLQDDAAPLLLTSDNRYAVVELCRHFDGLPLAIQLAADLLSEGSFKIDDPLPEISSWLDLPIRGTGGVPVPRHRTLRTCFRWSYLRCTPSERLLWSRLSVFRGSFTVDDVEKVGAGGSLDDDLLEALAALVDKSILTREERAGVAAYRLPSPLRAFGQAELCDLDELGEVRRRHLARYRQVLREAVAGWTGPGQPVWLDVLDRNWTDVCAAFETALGEPDRAAAALELATLLRPYWQLRGRFDEGGQWLHRALAAASAAGAGRERAAAHWAVAMLAAHQGRPDEVRAAVERARSADPDPLDPGSAALDDHVAGLLSLLDGDPVGAAGHFERAIERFGEQQPRGVGHLESLTGLATAKALAGDVERVQALHETVSATVAGGAPRGSVVSSYLAMSSWAAGLARWRAGAPDAATEAARTSLRMARSLGDVPGMLRGLDLMARLSVDAAPRRAAVLFPAVAALARSTGVPSDPVPGLRPDREQCERAVRAAVGTVTRRTAAERGRCLGPADAVGFALGESPWTPTSRRTDVCPAASGAPDASGLTRRQREVAELIGQGLSNREIADRLAVAPRTAEAHVENVMTKLGLASRAQVAVWVAEHRSAFDR